MDTTAVGMRADEEVAQRICRALHERIGPQKFNAWFKHGTRLTIDNGHIRLAVPNPFIANWIEGHYQVDIACAGEACTGTHRPVLVAIDPSLASEIRRHELDAQADIVHKTRQGRTRRRRPAQPGQLRHKLEDFVVGPSNKLAYSAAAAMAGEKRPPFNPLFVHGTCGVGKTHLLQGVCNQVSRMYRASRPFTWKYVTCEQFTNEFIQSLGAKNISQFRHRYRQLDLLAIDDVHFLAAKKATQDEFLHTFNAIESAGRRIVMASDAHPRLVGGLNERLVSRFVSGMVVKIDQPEASTRLSILTRKARGMKLKVGSEILKYIADHVRGSVRELEGALTKLAALAAIEGEVVTLELARGALADHLARTDSAVTLGDIEAAVSAFFAITPADIHSSRRTRTVSLARMVSMFLARRHTRMSYPEIGRAMGKNHSSAVLAVRRMTEALRADAPLTWTGVMGVRSMGAVKLLETLGDQFA